MNIPGTPKEIIEFLQLDYHHSLHQIAEETQLAHTTLHRILKGKKPHANSSWRLIEYYLQIKMKNQDS
jgi:hypothetical protein